MPNAGAILSVKTSSIPFATGTDEHWMQDVRIQYLAQHPYYANEDLQYQLPRRGGLASLFSVLPGRIDADGGLSYLTGRREGLFVKIPEDRELLLTAIGCGRRGTYDEGLVRQELPPLYRRQTPSDKARYCRGVLDLFGGIFSASHTFDTRFWKETFDNLAGLGGREANTQTGIVYQTIAKYPERWTLDAALPKEEEIARIEKEVVKLAQRVAPCPVDAEPRFAWSVFTWNLNLVVGARTVLYLCHCNSSILYEVCCTTGHPAARKRNARSPGRKK